MEKVLILSNHALNILPYHEILSEIYPKNKTLFISDRSTEEELNFHKDAFQSIKRFKNYFSSPQVELSACSLYKDWKFNRIVTISEFDLLRAARIRQHLNLIGQSYESAQAFRNKLIMKNLASKENFKTPAYKEINNILDLLEFIEEHAFPIILKPQQGVSAYDIFKVEDKKDLEKLLEKNLLFDHFYNTEYMAEKFIEGEMYHINGIVHEDKIIAIYPSAYFNNCLDIKDGKYLGSYLMDKDNPLTGRLVNYSKDLLNKFPTPSDGAFHLEVFHTKDDEILFCEVASRVAGEPFPASWEIAFQINPIHEFIKVQCGLPLNDKLTNFSATPEKIAGSLAFPSKSGILENIEEKCSFEWVHSYKTFLKPGATITQTKGLSDVMSECVIVADNQNDFIRKMHEMSEWVENSTSWR